jgi:WD40 repeat protein
LRVWELETGRCLRVLEGHTDNVSSVQVTPDGQRAISASWDKTFRAWDLATGKCLSVLEGHTSWSHSMKVTPDGLRAVSAGHDRTLRVWDLESGQCLALACLPIPASSFAFSSRLGQVVAGTSIGQVLQFDLRGISLAAASPAS